MKRFLILIISFITFLTLPVLCAAEAEERSDRASTLQEILILNSYHPGYAWSDDELAGIIDVLRAKDKNWPPVIVISGSQTPARWEASCRTETTIPQQVSKQEILGGHP
jgi:hypothetical protein